MSQQQQQVVNLESIPLQQLQAIQEQLSTEIQSLTNSFAQLKQAQAKFNDCNQSLDSINAANHNKSVLIPLTNSLYVHGKLKSDSERVIVDIGTGYYVEKNIEHAKQFYVRKMEYIKSNLDRLQQTIITKQDQLRDISQVAQSKAFREKQERAAAVEESA